MDIEFDFYDHKKVRDVVIQVRSEEAEEILFALALRAKQTGIRRERPVDIGNRLNDAFTKTFGWDVFDRMSDFQEGIKRVQIVRK